MATRSAKSQHIADRHTVCCTTEQEGGALRCILAVLVSYTARCEKKKKKKRDRQTVQREWLECTGMDGWMGGWVDGWSVSVNHIVQKWWIRGAAVALELYEPRSPSADEASIAGFGSWRGFSWGFTAGIHTLCRKDITQSRSPESRVLPEWWNRTASSPTDLPMPEVMDSYN